MNEKNREAAKCPDEAEAAPKPFKNIFVGITNNLLLELLLLLLLLFLSVYSIITNSSSTTFEL